MKERPILFSGPMVRAILEGRKTQTRRPVKPQPEHMMGGDGTFFADDARTPVPLTPCRTGKSGGLFAILCPYGQPGDRLWVRETWKQAIYLGKPKGFLYAADWKPNPSAHIVGENPWKPSIHMPRWASRITLEVTKVRLERLQEASEEDLRAEGYTDNPSDNFSDINTHWKLQRYFSKSWDSIYAARGFGWDNNPWVWVVEFKRI